MLEIKDHKEFRAMVQEVIRQSSNDRLGFSGGARGLLQPRAEVDDLDYTASSSDHLIAYTAITATRTVTLPDAASVPNQSFIITDEGCNAGGAVHIVITAAAGTVDAVASLTLVNKGCVAVLYSNGANYKIISVY